MNRQMTPPPPKKKIEIETRYTMKISAPCVEERWDAVTLLVKQRGVIVKFKFRPRRDPRFSYILFQFRNQTPTVTAPV